MKKFLAIVLSVMMVLSVGFSSVVASAAQTTIESQETTKKRVQAHVTVNGNTTSDITIDVDENDPNKITVTYTGDGELTGWNVYDADGNLLVEGVDYKIVMDGDVATITVLTDIDEIYVDAIIADETTEPTKPEDTTDGTTEPTKPNKDNESPNTGAIGLTGLAVAGAGAAILAAMKRKSDAE